MRNEYSKVHQQIGDAIATAKKNLFQSHREGMKIGDAVDRFIDELNESLNELAPCESPAPGKSTDASPEQIRDAQDAHKRVKVFQATSELLHNEQTPQDLFEAVAGFVCEQSNKADFHSDAILVAVLKSVPADELRSATLQARQNEEVNHASN